MHTRTQQVTTFVYLKIIRTSSNFVNEDRHFQGLSRVFGEEVPSLKVLSVCSCGLTELFGADFLVSLTGEVRLDLTDDRHEEHQLLPTLLRTVRCSQQYQQRHRPLWPHKTQDPWHGKVGRLKAMKYDNVLFQQRPSIVRLDQLPVPLPKVTDGHISRQPHRWCCWLSR